MYCYVHLPLPCRYEDYDAHKLVDCYLNLPQVKVGGRVGGWVGGCVGALGGWLWCKARETAGLQHCCLSA